MSSKNIEVRSCDRCDVVGEIREPWMGYQWGTIHARHANGPFHIGQINRPMDLCEGCMRALAEWWAAPKAGA